MAIPKYDDLYRPFLSVLIDEKPHSMHEIEEAIKNHLHLTAEEQAQRFSSGKSVLFDRVGWARTYLKKAGLITSPKRGIHQITSDGKQLFDSDTEISNDYLKAHYPAFAEFVSGGASKSAQAQATSPADPTEEETPSETFERVFRSINDQLADDLLSEVVGQSPDFFEQLVVDLMCKMGYGEGFKTKSSGDGGVDGVIHEDKLGFNLIYIQAKRWDPAMTIGKPEIQKFAGAMMGPPKVEKGLFITTARFSQGAREFADAQHIILIDGKRLTELMIEYDLGVSPLKNYTIKRVDSDYFNDTI